MGLTQGRRIVGLGLQVALVPGSAFGSPRTLRMSYATSMENLDKALDRISKALLSIKQQVGAS